MEPHTKQQILFGISVSAKVFFKQRSVLCDYIEQVDPGELYRFSQMILSWNHTKGEKEKL